MNPLKLFFLALLALSFASAPAFAEGTGPTVVNVSIYILNIGKFDVSSGAYTVDFYLDFHCDRECDPGDFEFMNGRTISNETIIDTPTEKFYRIQAALSDNIDMKKYPFDSHDLPIIIEDTGNTVENQVYVFDEKRSGVDPAVVLVGWDLSGASGEVDEHFYAPYDETYSRFTYSIGISRITLASILKTFLPIIFIVIVGLLALFIEERNIIWTRIGIDTSALIAAVMFHLNITSSIPPVGYLTFADNFMIITYVSLVLCIVNYPRLKAWASWEINRMPLGASALLHFLLL